MKTFAALAATLALLMSGCASLPSSSSPGIAHTETCKATGAEEIPALFEQWNRALQTGDPQQVVALYAEQSVLLPTLSNTPRLSAAEKEDYFQHFMEKKPVGRIDSRTISLGCNTAVDTGLYTFSLGATATDVPARYSYTYVWNGQRWLITSHHSSAMPEKN